MIIIFWRHVCHDGLVNRHGKHVYKFVSVPAPTPVSIGQIIGDLAMQRPSLDSWSNAMYIPNPDKYFTASSRVIGFQYYARRPAYLYLQVFRPAGGMRYKLVASIRHYASRAGVQTVKVRFGIVNVALGTNVIWLYKFWYLFWIDSL